MLGRTPDSNSDEGEAQKGFDAFDLKLGDVMRGERATLGKSLLDVQRELKIKANYIAAIENADASIFETPGFVAGYVRSYARYLGMDPEWAYQRFCSESGFQGAEAQGLSRKSPRKRAAPIRVQGEEAIIRPVAPYVPVGVSIFSQIEPRAVGSLAILLGLIGVLGYGGYSVLQEIQRVQFAPVDQPPGVIAEIGTPLQDSADLSAPAQSAPELAARQVTPRAEALDRLYRPQVLESPVLVPRDGPIAAIDPRTAGAIRTPPVVEATVPEEAPTLIADLEPPVSPVQVVAEKDPALAIFAVRPAWVRVSAADGTVLFEKILDTGERYVLPESEVPPTLRAGNSGSLYFALGDRTFGPAGSGTSVAKNVVLSSEAVSETYAEADPEADPALPEVLTAMAATIAAERAAERDP